MVNHIRTRLGGIDQHHNLLDEEIIRSTRKSATPDITKFVRSLINDLLRVEPHSSLWVNLADVLRFLSRTLVGLL